MAGAPTRLVLDAAISAVAANSGPFDKPGTTGKQADLPPKRPSRQERSAWPALPDPFASPFQGFVAPERHDYSAPGTGSDFSSGGGGDFGGGGASGDF